MRRHPSPIQPFILGPIRAILHWSLVGGSGQLVVQRGFAGHRLCPEWAPVGRVGVSRIPQEFLIHRQDHRQKCQASWVNPVVRYTETPWKRRYTQGTRLGRLPIVSVVLAVIIVIMPGHVARERKNRGGTVSFRGYPFKPFRTSDILFWFFFF